MILQFAHNKIVNNIKNEKEILTDQIWRFIVEELRTDISEYRKHKDSLDKAIESLGKKILERNQAKEEKKDLLKELEKQSTTIIPTRDGINNLLDSFGFKNFKLEIGDDNKSYKLVRLNGEAAHDTLSEGEKSFVAFLYFYYLLTGSYEESGFSNNKVVVFDDPVSSLDSEILFIVSNLIKSLLCDVEKGKGTIKQIFILTHNVYFHKEITYDIRRNKNGLRKDETFWLVKKSMCESMVEKQSSNPIKTAYELLWEEVRSDNRNNATIQNVLRRILENYFKLLGDISLHELYENFEGDEKYICKALCSWVNDGSHSAFGDDFYTTLDESMVEKYLDVFKQIFKESGQIAHYNMMMGIA